MYIKRLLVGLSVGLVLTLVVLSTLTIFPAQTYAQTGDNTDQDYATKREDNTNWNHPPAPPGRIGAASVGNGDFENGADGAWAETSTWGYRLIVTSTMLPVTPHSGNWAVWLGGGYSGMSAISQTLAITSGESILSYWLWSASADYCGYDFGKILINNIEVYSIDLCTNTNTNGWVNRTLDLSAYIGQDIDLQFRVTTDSSDNSNLFIDDVSLGQGYYVYLPCIAKNDCGFHFFDDFSNPNSGWDVESNTDYLMGYLPSEEYQIVLNNPGSWAFSVPNLDLSRNYRLDVDVYKTSDYEGAYGMLFAIGWGNNTYEAYQFLVEPETKKYLLDKRSMNGNWNALIGWSNAGMINSGTATNHLTVERIGSTIYLYINGQGVATAYDSSFSSPGRDLGLYVDSYGQSPLEVHFDNFRADCLP